MQVHLQYTITITIRGTKQRPDQGRYNTFISCLLEYCCVVGHSSLTIVIERVQKTFLKVILVDDYQGYQEALETCGIETLKTRRERLCLRFARKCIKSEKH